MSDDRRPVAIDTDFFRKFTEVSEHPTFFMRVMNALNLKPVMEFYVYDYELKGNSEVKKLVEAGEIQVEQSRDYFTANKQTYELQFRLAYKDFNGEDFHGDPYTYQKSEENLGEIRTMLMALFLGIDLLMTDDHDAKVYILNKSSNRYSKIEVCNVFDVLMKDEELKKAGISWSEVKGFAKRVFRKGKKDQRYIKLREQWHQDEYKESN